MSRPQKSAVAAPVLAAWLVGLVAASDPALSQTAADPITPASNQTRFSEVLDVELVELDALVTDKKNRPVLDLHRVDFEVSIGGAPVEITHFLKPRTSDAAADSPLTGDPETAVSIDRPLRLAIFVDSTSVEQGKRNTVIAEIQSFLRQGLRTRDQVMVVSVDRSTFRIPVTWTNDRTSIDKALGEISTTACRDHRGEEYGELVRQIERLASASTGYGASTIRGQAEALLVGIGAFAAGSRQDTLRTAENLKRLIDLLAGIPDRKVILYVGGGISSSPGEGLISALNSVLGMRGPGSSPSSRAPATPMAGHSDAHDALRTLARDASAHRIQLYAIEAGGHVGSYAIRASRGSTEAGGGALGFREDTWAPGLEFSQRIELGSALQMLASETGATALVSGGDRESFLRALADDRNNTYTLAARLDKAPIGEIQRIDVRVKKKGLKVRHRRSAQIWDQDELAAYQTRSALGAEVGENFLGLEIVAGDPQPVEKDSYLVSISLRLPLSALAVTARERSHEGQLSIFVTVSDRDSAAAAVRKSVVPFILSNEEILGSMGRMIQHRMDLELTKGPNTIAVGVRDDLDPALAIATLTLVVGDDGTTPAQ